MRGFASGWLLLYIPLFGSGWLGTKGDRVVVLLFALERGFGGMSRCRPRSDKR